METDIIWFAAHTLIAFKRTDGVGAISVYENVYIVPALNESVAIEYAKSISRLELAANTKLEIDGFPAENVGGGVRKLIAIHDQFPPELADAQSIGCEATYLEYELDDLAVLEGLLSGETVQVKLVD